MEKHEIVNIANELMGNPSKKQEYRLLNSLVGHHSIKSLTEEQFDTVCTFCEDVSKTREQMFKDLVTENDSEVDAIESIYNVSQSIKDMIEEAAFGELKRHTADILNRQWKKWKKVWRVECRGNVAWNNCGTVQIGLKEFAKARLEFVGINARNMFFGNEYKLAFRVERDISFANEIRDLLMKFPILLPWNCEISEKESTTIAIYNVHTAKPLAAMTSKQMTKFLNELYTKKLNYCCYQLVERFKDYK
jgi:hypothetical protein